MASGVVSEQYRVDTGHEDMIVSSLLYVTIRFHEPHRSRVYAKSSDTWSQVFSGFLLLPLEGLVQYEASGEYCIQLPDG